MNFGIGNLASIKNIIKKVGGKSQLVSTPEEIQQATKLILPGVGHFAKAMDKIDASGLKESLNQKVLEEKIPIMGICLGMQLMTKHSEEGDRDGFGWIDANTIKFQFEDHDIKVPHMGWNEITFKKPNIFSEAYPETSRFYFVHSYRVMCENSNDILTTSHYGGLEFHCGYQKDNIIGVQFHPEKSHKFGMAWMKSFLEWNP